MKVFQVENGICHWDATREFPSLEATVGFFPESLLFVESPDYVFEGWGYDVETGQFIQPTPPEGWLYDAETGTFYREGMQPPVDPLTKVRADTDFIAAMLGVEL